MDRKGIRILLVVLVLVGLVKLIGVKPTLRQEFLPEVEGKIVYLSRDDKLLNLYTSDANLENEKLVYSHEGFGEDNENIIEFYYDKKEDSYYFVAMKDGKWSLFSKKEGEKVEFVEIADMEKFYEGDFYISNENDKREAVSKNGSIYLIEAGEEKELIKFNGIYSDKFNPGYKPIGFSSGGRYLIYDYFGGLTPVGTIARGLVRDILGMEALQSKVYIMDLETKQINNYINIPMGKMQWIE